MEIVKIALLIGILLVYPLVPGAALLGILKKKKDAYSLGDVFVAGVLLCGVLFGGFAFVGVRLGWTLDIFSKAALILALLLLVVSGIICAAIRRCRNVILIVKSAWKEIKKEDLLIAFAFLLVALIYLIRPFSIEPGHDTAERVVTVVNTGRLMGADVLTEAEVAVSGNWKQQLENLPLFYACLCKWSGLLPADILFSVMPYVILVLVFCVISAFSDRIFQKDKASRRLALLLFAMITVCGNTAYMNTSYGFLHYPYEAMTIFSGILLPLLFLYAFSREHIVLLLLVGVSAVFLVGVEKAVWLIALLVICYAATLLVSRFAERRSK